MNKFKFSSILLMLNFQLHCQPLQPASIKSLTDCGLNQKSINLAQIIIHSSDQEREKLTCNKTLSQAAEQKARDLAKIDQISHSVAYVSPNEHLRNFGIQLPIIYDIIGNQVESILGGKNSPLEAYEYFMQSKYHKAHLLGENGFLKEQSHIGIGYHYDQSKDYQHFWVVYITSLKDDNNE